MNVPDDLGIADHDFRLVFGRTRIEYDESKEELNRKKHGYSLESAVFVLERLLIDSAIHTHRNRTPFATSDPFQENGEIRHMHMTLDDQGQVILIATTMRENETVRVISVRRAGLGERENFQQLTGYVEV